MAENESFPESPPYPRWMLTYTNLMMLIMMFFFLLFSASHVDKGKFARMAGSIKDSIGVEKGDSSSTAPVMGEGGLNSNFTHEIIVVRLMEKLRVVLEPMIKNNDADLGETQNGHVINLSEDALFQEGTIRFHPEIEPLLQQVANLIANVPNRIHVTGHTDNYPIDPTNQFPNNWAVSAAQASAVVNFFSTKGGVDPLRLQVRGMGSFAPRKSNNTKEGRAANRRIEILISRQTEVANASQLMESGGGLTDDSDLAEVRQQHLSGE